MARVMTISRTFPAYHPKKGQPTYFAEKIWKSLDKMGITGESLDKCINDYYQSIDGELAKYNDIKSKNHTIRAGNRWKVGDKFSPRVWSGKPYYSPQITIAPDIEVKKIWEVRIWRESLLNWRIYIDGKSINSPSITKLALNDGLSHRDLLDWFNVKIGQNFTGQIVCWNETIEY